jgi:hypothetical protein
MFNGAQMETLLYESLSKDAPTFLTFLRSHNLLTVQSFLLTDSETLADDWATRTGLARASSRDFIGAMKFRFNGLAISRLSAASYMSNRGHVATERNAQFTAASSSSSRRASDSR